MPLFTLEAMALFTNRGFRGASPTWWLIYATDQSRERDCPKLSIAAETQVEFGKTAWKQEAEWKKSAGRATKESWAIGRRWTG